MSKIDLRLGDCYKLIKDLPDKSVDLIYTDVPYDIEGNGGSGCFGEKKRDYHAEYEKVCQNTSGNTRVWKAAMKNIDGIKEIAFGIDYGILDEFCRVLKNIYVYIWCSKAQILPLMNYFVGEHGCRFEILTWHKCLSGSTELWCKNKFNEIFKSNLKDLFRHTDWTSVSVFNGKKWTPIYNIVKSKHDSHREITLRNGNTISCSDNHKFAVNGGLVVAKDLQVGNVLDSCKLEIDSNKNLGGLSTLFAWFIGYYIANGSLSTTKIQLNTHQDKLFVVEKVKKLCEEYNGSYYLYDKPNSKSRRIIISSAILLAGIKEYISGSLAYGKHLTGKVFNTNLDFCRNILFGYLEGDGYKETDNRWRLGFTRKNYLLAKDLQSLCNILGYSLHLQKGYTSLNGKKFPIWRGRIRVKDERLWNKSDYEIVSIKNVNHKNGISLYDLQLTSDDHLFCLSDGVISHNSNPFPTANGKYLSDTEYCLMFRDGGKTKIGGTMKTKQKYYISPLNVKDKGNFLHPTIKPLPFVENHILNSTKEGDTVLDCFMGSGTTGLACKHLNRNFIGFEIEEKWYNIAKNRLEGYNAFGQGNFLEINGI